MIELAIAAFASGGLAKGYAAFQQARIQNLQLQYQQDIAERNAEMALFEEDYIKEMAAVNEKKQRDKVSQFLGAQRVQMGASGFTVGSATFQDMIDTTVVLGELDALAIRYDGELAAWRKREEAKRFRYEAEILETAKIQPELALGLSLLGSGAKGAQIFGT